jgi:hypothetical protein
MSLKSPTLKQQIELMRYALPRDLGDGLVLRVATRDDAELLAQFNGRVFGRERFDELLAAYVRHYASESHPIIGPSNVLLVEDTRAPAATRRASSATAIQDAGMRRASAHIRDRTAAR